MKNSYVYVRIDLGPVLDETVMDNADVIELIDYVDINLFPMEPMAHVLTDLDTGKIVSFESLVVGEDIRLDV